MFKGILAAYLTCSVLFPIAPSYANLLGEWTVESVMCAGGPCAVASPDEQRRFQDDTIGRTVTLRETQSTSEKTRNESSDLKLLNCPLGVDLSGIKYRNGWDTVVQLPASPVLPEGAIARFIKTRFGSGNGINPLKLNLDGGDHSVGVIRCKGTVQSGEPSQAYVILANPFELNYYDVNTQNFLILRRTAR